MPSSVEQFAIGSDYADKHFYLKIMEKMEVDDDTVVDLSVKTVNSNNSNSTNSNSIPNPKRIPGKKEYETRRSLRPRQDKNYSENVDIIAFSDEEPKTNGYYNHSDSDSDYGEMPPLPTIKELSPTEVEERERGLRKLREELRNEEMKLVLLKKLRLQSKENMEIVTSSIPEGTTIDTVKIITDSLKSSPSAGGVHGGTPHQRPSSHTSLTHHHKTSVPSMLRGQPNPTRHPSVHHPPPSMISPQTSNRSGAAGAISAPAAAHRPSLGRPPVNASSTLPGIYPNSKENSLLNTSVTITTPQAVHSTTPTQEQRPSRAEDNQTTAQRQAAAKLALRKQLEKTLLQIPPPKPPPPEMHFVPNSANMEFIYLLGLEHVVDFLTREQESTVPPEPFHCWQCRTNFTPVWKWERAKARREAATVICERCVTSNVKKALKAEHTNRLKTAFVKALQQEQEIEQRLASQARPRTPPPPKVPTPPQPAPPPPPPVIAAPPKPSPKLPPPTAAALAPKAAPSQPPKLSPQQQQQQLMLLHQQLMRGLSNPQQMQQMQQMLSPFSSMLYSYQLALGGINKSAMAEIQRQTVDLQRQYLLDMIPTQQATATPARAHQSQPHAAHSRSHSHSQSQSRNHHSTPHGAHQPHSSHPHTHNNWNS